MTELTNKIIRISKISLCCLFTVLVGCQENDHKKSEDLQLKQKMALAKVSQDSCIQFLSDGCVVFRKGNDVISGLFTNLNVKSQKFSHCGIAFKENNIWYVYHSIGGEDNPDEKLRREPFYSFTSRLRNHSFGIATFSLNINQVQKLSATVKSFFQQEIPFDMKFDIESNDRFYCAEMVYKAFNAALDTSQYFSLTHHPSFDYVATDDIFLHKDAQLLCHVVY